MWETFRSHWEAKLLVFIFLLLTLWWGINNFAIGNSHIQYDTFWDFGDFYGIIALLGGVFGVNIARKWGGIKSVMGKAVLMFSLGLFAQEFGQLAYALYNDIYHTPGPYPSLGDIGYFGSIPLYIAGVIYLGHASGITIGLKTIENKLSAVIIPLVVLIVGYFLFLPNYKFDWSNPIKIFLDFGYPLGQSFYISLAILIYLLSKDVLGGVMKSRILFILFALCVQFLSDYTFLYQSNKGIWHVGEINDYMYLVAYFLMSIGLFQFQTVLTKLKHAS